MPIKVILQAMDGKREDEVVDPEYSLANIWPVDDRSYPLLQYVDPYGNTMFNRQQMPEVRKELNNLLERASTDKQRDILLRILALVAKCEDRPHMLLRFRGD